MDLIDLIQDGERRGEKVNGKSNVVGLTAQAVMQMKWRGVGDRNR